MRHPSDGTLRRLVDEPVGVPDSDRQHVAGCPVCLTGLAAAQEAAVATATALAPTGTPDVDRAWAQLGATLSAPQPGRATAAAATRPSSGRWRRALRRPVVAAAGVVLVVGGASAAAAADWLPVFSTDQVQAVQVSAADLVSLPDLSGYGELTVVSEPDVRSVADAAAAERATGLELPAVAELPAGVTGQPSYTVGDQVVADFTFSAGRAAAGAGEDPPPVPAGLDGSRFRLSAGPGLAQTWSEARGLPALVVARVVAPTAMSSGVPFETARDYLLSLPGLPADLADQLRGFTDGASTLPLPVPADLATTSTAEVDGHEATVLATRDGLLTGVVWVADGVVTAVAGTVSEDEVLAVARGLR